MTLKARRWATLAGLAMVLAATVSVATRSLWEPDEARYAEVAREMRVTGDLVQLRLNGRLYTHKPPLYIWVEAGLQEVGLSYTAAGVLPVTLAFLLLVPALRALARAVGCSNAEGELAFAFLAASPLAAAAGLLARMDGLLVLTHTVALAHLARLLLGADDSQARRSHLAMWLAIGAGILLKGPIALALPLATALVAAAVLRPRPALRPVFTGWGPLLAVAIVLAWLVPAALAAGPDFLREVIVRQSAGRITGSFAHPEPFYYHLVSYPLTGLPWAPVVIVGVVAALARRRRDPGGAFLAITVTTTVVLFSLVSGKLAIYLLPLFPAAALLAVRQVASGDRPSRWALVAGGVLLVIAGAALAAAPRLRPEAAGVTWQAVVAGATLAVPAALAVGAGVLRRSTHRVAGLLLIAGLSVPAVLVPLVAGGVDRWLAVRDAAEVLARLEPDSREGLVFRREMAGLSLYAGRIFTVIEERPELDTALASGRAVVVLERDWHRLEADGDSPPASAVASFPFRRRRLLIVRPVTASGPAADGRSPAIPASPR